MLQPRTDRLLTDRSPAVASAAYQAKLTGLVRNRFSIEVDPISSPGHAGGWSRSDNRSFVLLDGDDDAALDRLGPVLFWWQTADHGQLENAIPGRLSLIAPPGVAAEVARRAEPFAGVTAELEVFTPVGVSLEAVEAQQVAAVPELSQHVWALAGLINESGARAVDDHGRLVAELAGLEVARVSDEGPDPLIEVGVGQADRELHQLVHGGLETDAAIRRAVAMVAAHRHSGANPHPLNRMARERWLRAMVLDDPTLVGAAALDPVPPLRPRATVLGTEPVAALGTDNDGGPMLVVCSSGVDPNLVLDAADYRRRDNPAASLVVVVPPRDRYRITSALLALLPNAELLSMAPPWETT